MNLLLFMLLSLFWGGSFIAIGWSVSDAPPLFCGFLRVSSALVLLAVIFPLLRKPLTVPRKALPIVWLAGLFAQGIPFSFLFWAEKQISPGLAGIFNGTVPIWTYLMGWAVMRKSEPPSRSKLFGVILGLLGITLIFLPRISQPGSSQALLGTLAVLGMALSYSVGTLLNRRILSGNLGVTVSGSTFQQSLASLLYLGILSALIEHWPAMDQVPYLGRFGASILYLGWLSTGIAFLIYFRLIREWGAVRASSVTYIVPVFAVLLDFLINGNRPLAWEAAGTLVILTGILLIQRSK